MKKMFIAHDPWDNIVQFQKVWYPRNQLVEIFLITVVPKKFLKKGAPYQTTLVTKLANRLVQI